MLVNPTYGAGGAQSSGYVEEELLCLYDGDTQTVVPTPTATESSGTYDWGRCNSSQGATIEGYITMTGASVGAYSRGFNAGVGGTEFCLGFGNGGGGSNSDYFFNPMIFWGGSVDYNIYPNDLKYGDKHTFAIVSTPDPEEVEQNVLSFYVDGVQVGDTKQQNRNAIHNTFYGIVVEGGTSRPMNGTLLSGRFYTRALTVAELAANHANDIAKYGGNT